MTSSNQLQKGNNTSSLTVLKNAPLLYYPDLKDTDIHNSSILSKEEKQVLLAALNFPKISTLNIEKGEVGEPNTESYDMLVDIIGLSIYVTGVTEKSMTKAEQKMFIPLAIQEIKNEFQNLTIEDVRIAFHRGSRRKYGDLFQMSIVTINIWLTKYTEETKREVMLRLPYVKPVQEKPKELSNEEKLKIHNEWLENIYKNFDEFKKTNTYDYYDFNNKLYNYLKKLGLINLNEEWQEKIWNIAVKELKEEYHPKNGRNYGHRIDLKRIYDALKFDEVDKKHSDLVVMRAKKITIKYLFTTLNKKSKHIKEVIEEAINKNLKISK
jgi:hypothetical protein